ncbi:MAG: tetratricopeptide repeat protein [Promethearchaeota archaeon]
MRISMHQDLERAMKLIGEGKIEEPLQIFDNFKNLEHITPRDKHYYRFFKGTIVFQMGKLQEGLKIAEQDYKENESKNNPLFLIDAVFLKWNILLLLGKGHEERENVIFCEKLLKSVTKESPSELKLREGFLFCMKGFFLYWEQKYDEAIELYKKSLLIFEKYVITSILIPFTLNLLGLSYRAKGELDLALESHKKCIELSRGSSIAINMRTGVTYSNIGEIYFQKGSLDQASEYYKKSLKVFEQYKTALAVSRIGISFDSLIKVYLYKRSPEEAQQHLNLFYQYIKRNNISKNFSWYRLAKARMLKSSPRIRNRAEAEKILRELIGEHRGVDNEFIIAIIELCDFYFEELRLTNEIEIIDDIQPLIERLLKESKRTNSYTLQAQTYLLHGKISLLQINMSDARRYLTQAQSIAEEHGLQLLAREISMEHDKLLDQLDEWEDLKIKETSISERMNLASLKESIDLLQRKRELKAPELTDEEPILLLIISTGGVLLFSYSFSNELKIDDELFGGFLSAITSFSDEIFSQGLDRAKFGSYTVLMNNVGPFFFCYLLKGQTYLAKKKLSNFTENLQKNSSMMETLNKFNQRGQVIELKDFPFLEGFIQGIFNKK